MGDKTSNTWKNPVRIYIGTGAPDIIFGPIQAFEALTTDGRHREVLSITTRSGYAVWLLPEKSRWICQKAFVSAAVEASVFDGVVGLIKPTH